MAGTKRNSVHETNARKRDTIIKNIKLKKNPDGFIQAKEILDNYIDKHNKKHTAERIYVLEKLYQLNTPVDVETLHSLVNEQHLISKVTVYNALTLFEECKIAHRVDLVGGSLFFFEKTIGTEAHLYVICKKCGCITTVPSTALCKEAEKLLPRTFHADDFLFYANGLCRKCLNAWKKAEQRNKERNERLAQKAKTKCRKGCVSGSKTSDSK